MPNNFPESFFEPPPRRTEDWPDNPELRNAVDWLRGYIPDAEWRKRRQAAANRLYDTALGRIDADDKGRYFTEQDTFGWYLFLAEAFLDHIWNYDPMFGARVVPIIMSIGRNLGLLRDVEGIDDRARRLVGRERGQPNGALFEFLVAAAYRRAGAKVVFLPERPGQAKTHDMDVTLDGQTLAVECKRMEVSEYSERERTRMRELWKPSGLFLAKERRTTFCNARFCVPIQAVPADYLTARTKAWIASSDAAQLWDDNIASGAIGTLDLGPLNEALADHEVLASGSRILQLLSGSYERNANFVQILSIKRADNPRYLKACDMAVLLKWSSMSPQSIDGKARDILRKLAEANRQLPTDRPGIVHIGFEAVDGDVVERARYDKIIASTAKFDPGNIPLEYVMCHYLVPESPPELSFAYDETTQWCPIRPSGPQPLGETFLVLAPDETLSRRGTHWQ